ncbi:MAG: hypothetical protein LBT46_13320 [Planctomycetaceae bacterium]|jgi:L-fucose isomerase-like protein|nr:hypothetical protein [Planctomycetaceae bacterium]
MSVAVFFISRKRPGFDPAWGAFVEQNIRTQLQKTLPDTLFYSPIADEHALKTALNNARQNEIDAVIISQPTMGDGNLWTLFASEWNAPVILWATPENPDNPKVSACGLVGVHNWASGLAQVHRPALIVYGLPNEKETVRELNEAICIAQTVKKIRQARIGLIGGHAPGFLNMAVDASLLQRLLGSRLKHIGLHEFINIVRSLPDSLVAEDRKKAEALNIPVRYGVRISEEALNWSSRYYLALRQVFAEEAFDAAALRCWGELPNELGVWAYAALARLADEGFNICEEGDAGGAIGCLLAQTLGAETPAFNTDWLEHDDVSITLWHGGATPFSICEPNSLSLDVHFNTGKPLVVNARLKEGIPVTLFRLWRFDNEYRLAIIEGISEKPQRYIDGFYARVRVGGGVKQFFLDACTAGMPHHIAVVQGRWASQLKQFAAVYQPQLIKVALQLGVPQ